MEWWHQIWDSLDSVRKIHSRLELWALLIFATMVITEIIAQLIEPKHQVLARRLETLGLIMFGMAVLLELIAYPFSQRNDALADNQHNQLQQKLDHLVVAASQPDLRIHSITAKATVMLSTFPVSGAPLPETITLVKNHSAVVTLLCDIGNAQSDHLTWAATCQLSPLAVSLLNEPVDALNGVDTLQMRIFGGERKNFKAGLENVASLEVQIEVNALPLTVLKLTAQELIRFGSYPTKDSSYVVQVDVSDAYSDATALYSRLFSAAGR